MSVSRLLQAALKVILKKEETVIVGKYLFTQVYRGKPAIINKESGAIIWRKGKKDLEGGRAKLLVELCVGELKGVGEKMRVKKKLSKQGRLVTLWSGKWKDEPERAATFLMTSETEGIVIEQVDNTPSEAFVFKNLQEVKLPESWTWSKAVIEIPKNGTALSPKAIDKNKSD